MHEPLFDIAAARNGVLTHRQLTAAGLTASAIQRRVDARWLVPITRGVYCVASTPIARVQRITAAVLVHPESAADGADAALMLGLPGPAHVRGQRVQIVLPLRHRCDRSLVDDRRQVHRGPGDVVIRNGTAVLAPARLIVDMAGRWPALQVARTFDGALRDRLIRVDDVRAVHAALGRRGRKGVALLDRLLAERSDGSHRLLNGFEERTRRLLIENGFPEPVPQYRITMPDGNQRFVDLAYPFARLGIEPGGFTFHSVRTDWARDQVRLNEFVALGWRMLVVTDETIARPTVFLRQVAAALERAA